jgi:hypothetical protein
MIMSVKNFKGNRNWFHRKTGIKAGFLVHLILAVFLDAVSTVCTKEKMLFAQHKTEIAWKTVDNVLIPIPPQGHPRLYLTKAEAVEIGARLKEPVLSEVVERLRSHSHQSTQLKIEWDALQYLASQDKKLGRTVIDSTLALLKRTELPQMGDGARYTGRMMTTGAMVYDWLYPLLTPSDKTVFIDEFVRLAKTLECDYPPTKQGSVTGHSSESFIMRDMLSAGIAIYDEFPEMYEVAAVRFFREHLPARNWLYNGHAYHQGDSYGPLRFSWDTYPLMIFHRMGVDNIYNPEQRYVPYYYIYATRPDGQRMRSGDTFLHSNHGAPRGKPWDLYVGALFTASYYGDGVILDQFIRQGGGNLKAHGRISQHEDIFQFLWWNVALQPKPVNSLPLSKYFGPPFGWMVARTGWDANSVIAEMKINVYNFNNHQHMDAGAFQIYYRGPLATESGLYNGTSGGYGSPHCKNYYWRTIAHNSLLVYDPQEQFSPKGDYGNDGGQRLPNNRSEPRNLEMLLDPKNGYKTGEVLAQGMGPDKHVPDFTYLKGDITEAYSAKVSEVKRSFVFLNLKNDKIPAALVVYDKVVSESPSFKKYWLLHSMERPAISGNEITVVRSRDGDSGKLVNTSLIPETSDLEITPVGGPGKEFWVFGQNHENEQRNASPEDTHEHAEWRIELSPKSPAKENHFLNVMQVMDRDGKKLNARKIDGDKAVGVQVSDRVVFFSKDSETVRSQISFSIQDRGVFKVLVTDLAAGEWQVLKDDKVVVPSAMVIEGEGILYFEGAKGRYSVRRK